MATFPRLRTNAVVQYPITRRQQFQNQTVRFVDGSDQRYRDSAGAHLEWDIQLSVLDDGELSALEEFFLAAQGSFGAFSFTDPWDGRSYDNCSLAADEMVLTTVAEMRGGTKLTIVSNT